MLTGENGAGRSTLMKGLPGPCSADPCEEILVDDQKVEVNDSVPAKRLGIAIVYLAPSLTVAEDFLLSGEFARWGQGKGRR